MSNPKLTPLHSVHVAAGATMVDFGGWDMPIQYPSGIVAEHLNTRRNCGLFDVSHMGRLIVEGPQRVAFLQKVLSNNVEALPVGRAQYCIIPAPDGSAVDDAYLYRFEADRYLLVVNASNTDKDLAHFAAIVPAFDCTITDITGTSACLALQGPNSEQLLQTLSGCDFITGPKKNDLNTLQMEGHTVQVSRTGYTGEPVGFELFVSNEDVLWLWNRLAELGATPTGLGARDTLRLEASLPLYGHEMGLDPDGKAIPVFAVSLAKFAVSFLPEKGDFVGRKVLEDQFAAYQRITQQDFHDVAALPKRIVPIALLDRGVMRAGMQIYCNGQAVGWVTSGTMVPYYQFRDESPEAVPTDATGKRSIGFAYISSTVTPDDVVEIDVRGKRLKAKLTTRHIRQNLPPYVRPRL